jgi:hypothetical protein
MNQSFTGSKSTNVRTLLVIYIKSANAQHSGVRNEIVAFTATNDFHSVGVPKSPNLERTSYRVYAPALAGTLSPRNNRRHDGSYLNMDML